MVMGPRERDEALGALLIGTWGASSLSLLELCWAFTYYRHYSNGDTILLKIIIAVTIVIDFLGLIAECSAVYQYSVTHWGDEQYLRLQYWQAPVYAACGAIVAAVVQGYLTSRYFRLTKNWFVAFGLCLLTLLEFGATITVSIVVAKWSAYGDRFRLEIPSKIWLISEAIVNVLIALALVSALYTYRTASKRMNTIISRLTILTIESGCIPALFALGILIGYILAPSSNIPNAFFFPVSHLYVLTMLYTLNVRKSLRDEPTSDVYSMVGIKDVSTSAVKGSVRPMTEEIHNDRKVQHDVEMVAQLPQNG